MSTSCPPVLPATRRSPFCFGRFREAGIRPQIRLGQNFLIDLNLQRVLLETAASGPEDVVLEIGTGTGALTALMAPRVAAVVTVEIDRQLFHMAADELMDASNVTMLQVDALKNKNRLNPAVLEAVNVALDAAPGRHFKLVANLPYQVATPMLTNLLALDRPPETMTCTIQKEVAERIVALPGTKDYGALAIWMQSQCRLRNRADFGPLGLLAAAQGLFGLPADRARSATSRPHSRSGIFPRFRAGDVLSPPQVPAFPASRRLRRPAGQGRSGPGLGPAGSGRHRPGRAADPDTMLALCEAVRKFDAATQSGLR